MNKIVTTTSAKLYYIELIIIPIGEWFCSSFEGKAAIQAYKEFLSLKPKLKKDILYGGQGKDGNLKEIGLSEYSLSQN